jgi:hypothetical protein
MLCYSFGRRNVSVIEKCIMIVCCGSEIIKYNGSEIIKYKTQFWFWGHVDIRRMGSFSVYGNKKSILHGWQIWYYCIIDFHNCRCSFLQCDLLTADYCLIIEVIWCLTASYLANITSLWFPFFFGLNLLACLYSIQNCLSFST